MGQIEIAIKPIDEYLSGFRKNIKNNRWELEIGIPDSWIFESNDEIECEILNKSALGKEIKILSKNDNVVIDDLVKFVEVLINVNGEYVAINLAIEEEMARRKREMEEELEKRYKELDDLKANAFSSIVKKREDKIEISEPENTDVVES